MAVHHIAHDLLADRPAPRRYAWTVFAILFALMVVDYVDRQVIVSMFSHLKAEWSLSDGQLGALVSIVSVTVALGAVPLSLLADRWSRVKSIFLMALIWSLATHLLRVRHELRATPWHAQRRRHSAKPLTAPSARRCSPRCSRCACAAPCSARSSWPASSARCSASCWAASSPSAGAGRPASARSAFPDCSSPSCSSSIVRDYKTVALPGASGLGRTHARRGARHRRRAAAAAHRARRMHRRRLPAPHDVDDVRVACRRTSHRYYGLAPDAGGSEGRLGRAGGRHRRRCLGHASPTASLRASPVHASTFPRSAPCSPRCS